MIELLFYLFLNALRIYIMQRFVRLFFYKETYRKCMPYCYLAYYVINCTAYLFLGVDRLNLAVNILGYYQPFWYLMREIGKESCCQSLQA